MKYIIVILVFFSCCTPHKASNEQINCKDTVRFYVTDTVEIQKNVHDTIFVKANTDSLKTVITDLNRKLFLANFKLERVKYYLKICQRNPSQVKFLVSWITRALN